MAATLKIDGTDFYQYVRVAPGDGLDPASPGFQDPQFGDTVSSDSQPLISVNERNKELVWPVHLNASTKQGLHDLIVDVNRRLAEAIQVEWKDDGATNSTFYDVLFARFEPDYNYRRAQVRWLSGSLRIWVKPYGSTGTYRLVSSAPIASYGNPGFAQIGATVLAGDVPANICASFTSGYKNGGSGAFIGMALLPTRSLGFFSASYSWPGGALATITQSTSAIGSMAARTFITVGTQNTLAEQNLPFVTREVAPGRHHLIGIVRTQATTAAASGVTLIAVNPVGDGAASVYAATTPYGPTIVLAPSVHWKIVDFGVITINASGYNGYKIRTGYLGGTAGSATGAVDFSGMYVLPENETIFSRDQGTNNFLFFESNIHRNNGVLTGYTPDPTSNGILPRAPVGTNPQYKMMFFAYGDLLSPVTNFGPAVVGLQERFTYAR